MCKGRGKGAKRDAFFAFMAEKSMSAFQFFIRKVYFCSIVCGICICYDKKTKRFSKAAKRGGSLYADWTGNQEISEE